MQNPQSAAWWLESCDRSLQGLTQAEAERLRAQWGPNLMQGPQRAPVWQQYLARFRNPLVLILLVASAISALSGEVADFVIIALIVLLSITLDFVQEHRANRASEKLRESVSLLARVEREGQLLSLPVSELVPGDVVRLSAGDRIPADAWVLEAQDLFVMQAALTGESYPVEKSVQAPPPSATQIESATHAVFMGTSVISGTARVRVARTGAATALGQVAQSLVSRAPPTAFEIGTHRFGLMILRLTLLMVLFVLMVNAWSGKPLMQSFLFAIALAVGLTPELLPMVTSVTLARGALRMARQRMIVKKLSTIQDLGSMDVLCTDKTGTLTESRIRVECSVDAHGQASPRPLQLAWLNSHFESGLRNPMDEAVLAQPAPPLAGWRKVDEVPFDFERRCVSVLIDNGAERWLIAKGAAGQLLRGCSHYESSAEPQAQPLDEAALGRLQAQLSALESQGLRVLAVAWRRVDRTHDHAVIDDESDLVLAGFVAFMDPPKASAASALQALRDAGVGIRIVTGDSPLVTRHVCEQLQLPVLGELTGEDIDHLDEAALRVKVDQVTIFCRVNPVQKARVIHALRGAGHVVGYLGDGINDAPSLHAADIGLSVDTAVDVAKEEADMILLDNDLGVLHAAVMEGRRTFANIMKYIMMGTSSNFGNMLSMAGAALFLPFLPMLPTQILLNNILYDLSEAPIPLDRVDAADLARPRRMDLTRIRRFMLVIGPLSSCFDFLTFYLLWSVLKAEPALFQTGWFVESLCTQTLVVFIIRTRGHPLRSHPHPLLLITSLLVALTGVVLPMTPLAAVFGFEPLPAHVLLWLGAMVLAYLLVVRFVKQWFDRRWAPA